MDLLVVRFPLFIGVVDSYAPPPRKNLFMVIAKIIEWWGSRSCRNLVYFSMLLSAVIGVSGPLLPVSLMLCSIWCL